MESTREDHHRLLKKLKRTAILSLILLVISFMAWMASRDHTATQLSVCFFWVGAAGVGLGTIFGLNSHSFIGDVFDQHSTRVTSMSLEESRLQAWKNVNKSYASAHLFIASGFALIVLSFLIELFTGTPARGRP